MHEEEARLEARAEGAAQVEHAVPRPKRACGLRWCEMVGDDSSAPEDTVTRSRTRSRTRTGTGAAKAALSRADSPGLAPGPSGMPGEPVGARVPPGADQG